MPKILGYSTKYDKLKEGFKLPEIPEEEEYLWNLIMASNNIHHTTIRLDKGNGWYHAGTWQEVIKPRSRNRVKIIRSGVEVMEPISITLGELEEYPILLEYDTLENGVGMTYAEFYSYVEDFYGKTEFWKKNYTKLLILPIVCPLIINWNLSRQSLGEIYKKHKITVTEMKCNVL
jgi:hypothetical protein